MSATNTNGTAPAEKKSKTDKEARRQRFLDVFPTLTEELVGYVKSTGSPEEVWGWFERVSPMPSSLTHFSWSRRDRADSDSSR